MKEQEQLDFVEWIEKLEFKEMKIPKPDFNLYLHIDVDTSLNQTSKRGKREYQEEKDDIYENNQILLSKASNLYSKLCENRKDWFKINQMVENKQASEKDVFHLIKEKIMEII
jgi:thymidylate kinase